MVLYSNNLVMFACLLVCQVKKILSCWMAFNPFLSTPFAQCLALCYAPHLIIPITRKCHVRGYYMKMLHRLHSPQVNLWLALIWMRITSIGAHTTRQGLISPNLLDFTFNGSFFPDSFEFTLCHSVQITLLKMIALSLQLLSLLYDSFLRDQPTHPSRELLALTQHPKTALPVRVLYGEICLDVIIYRFTVSVADWWHDS